MIVNLFANLFINLFFGLFANLSINLNTSKERGAMPGSESQVSDLPQKLGAPARRALASAGYDRLEQLAGVSEAQLLRLHGMGPKAIGQLQAALAERGLPPLRQ